MVDTLHLTHAADQSMLESAKDRIYWPGLRKQLHVKYQTCKECSYNRISQTRPANECSQSNLFENFFPNSYLQADFLQFNDTDIMVVVDTLTGFGKAYKTRNKTTEEAIKVMRSWIAQWGRPLELTVDAGPAYRERFCEELLKLGVIVRQSSAYYCNDANTKLFRCFLQLGRCNSSERGEKREG